MCCRILEARTSLPQTSHGLLSAVDEDSAAEEEDAAVPQSSDFFRLGGVFEVTPLRRFCFRVTHALWTLP